jgi:hypothetical protein
MLSQRVEPIFNESLRGNARRRQNYSLKLRARRNFSVAATVFVSKV